MPSSNAPRLSFTSDNVAGASPEIIDAISRCNEGFDIPYGADACTARVETRLADIFEHEVSVFLVPTGSAANALCLGVMTPPWGNVLCHPGSHINNDECGAPEFYTNGAKLVSVDGENCKIDPTLLREQAHRKVGDVHSTQQACVSITQATEVGSVYSVEEIGALGEVCRESGLGLHMDGSRFANALVSMGCTPAQMTWQAGVDALSFGATKNGVLAGEAIILFEATRAKELAYRRKRGGHLFSKMRLLSAQMEAYLKNDLWLNNARVANAMAQRLATGLHKLPGIELQGPTSANILFCKLPVPVIDGLQAQGFGFYRDRWGPEVIRLVTSWATREGDVDHLLNAVHSLIAPA